MSICSKDPHRLEGGSITARDFCSEINRENGQETPDGAPDREFHRCDDEIGCDSDKDHQNVGALLDYPIPHTIRPTIWCPELQAQGTQIHRHEFQLPNLAVGARRAESSRVRRHRGPGGRGILRYGGAFLPCGRGGGRIYSGKETEKEKERVGRKSGVKAKNPNLI